MSIITCVYNWPVQCHPKCWITYATYTHTCLCNGCIRCPMRVVSFINEYFAWCGREAKDFNIRTQSSGAGLTVELETIFQMFNEFSFIRMREHIQCTWQYNKLYDPTLDITRWHKYLINADDNSSVDSKVMNMAFSLSSHTMNGLLFHCCCRIDSFNSTPLLFSTERSKKSWNKTKRNKAKWNNKKYYLSILPCDGQLWFIFQLAHIAHIAHLF